VEINKQIKLRDKFCDQHLEWTPTVQLVRVRPGNNLLAQPRCCRTCSNAFCLGCITNRALDQGTCPSCLAKIDCLEKLPTSLHKILNSIEVQCLDCSRFINYEKQSAHREECTNCQECLKKRMDPAKESLLVESQMPLGVSEGDAPLLE
jgi:hypothetical protein